MKSVLTYIAILLGLIGYSQEPFYIHYTTENGLPSNETYDIIQDSTGFIWIGTDKGLARFDGSNFRQYTTSHGLPGHTITNLFLDNDNNVWCIAFGTGLAYCNGDSLFLPKWHDEILPHTERLNRLRHRADGTYMLTFSGVEYDKLLYLEANEDDILKKVYADAYQPNNNILWSYSVDGETITTEYREDFRDSILIVDGHSNETRIYHLDKAINSARKSLILNDKSTIALSGSQVLRLDDKVENYDLGFNLTNGLLLDSRGDLWTGTVEGGAFLFPNADITQEPRRFLEGLTITGIYEDREGAIWFSTSEDGIYLMPYRDLLVMNEASGLPEKRITYGLLSEDTLYMIYRNGAITKTTVTDPELRFDLFRDYRYVFDAYIDRNGKLNVGVDTPDPSDHEVVGWKPSSYLLEEDTLTYFAATSGPIIIYNNRTGKTLDTLGERNLPRIYHMLHMEDGTLYLGSKKGLFTWKDGEFNTMAGVDRLFERGIVSMALCEDKVLISVAGIGVAILEGEQVTWLTTQNVLHNSFVTNITVEGKEAWLCSANGIDLVDLDQIENGYPKTIHIDIEQGLPNPSVNDVVVIGDSIWVMSDNGMAIIPREIIRELEPPALYTTSFKVNGIEVDSDKHLALDPFENNLELGFQAISYKNVYSQRYAYRFTNRGEEWTSTTANQLNFANLSPGEYELIVTTSPSDLRPDATLIFSFKILRPLWQRWYVLLIIAVAITGIVLGYYQNRIRVIKRQNEYERQISTLSYRALRAQMNPHFIYNALNAIQNFIINRDEKASIAYLGSFSRLIRSIFENSSKDLVTVETEATTLELYVELEQARYPERFSFHLNIDEELRRARISPMIIQPFIENAILHGLLPQQEKGIITLTIQRTENGILVVIEDNGIGIVKGREIGEKKRRYLQDVRNTDRQSGMRVTKERIEQLAQRFDLMADFQAIDLGELDSSVHGTRVSFNLPYISGE